MGPSGRAGLGQDLANRAISAIVPRFGFLNARKLRIVARRAIVAGSLVMTAGAVGVGLYRYDAVMTR